MELLTLDQVRLLADRLCDTGKLKEAAGRRAVLIRIGFDPNSYAYDGSTSDFATNLVSDVNVRDDGEALCRLVREVLGAFPNHQGLLQIAEVLGVESVTGSRANGTVSAGPAQRGLVALKKLLEDPEVRDAAVEFHSTFAQTCSRIGPVVDLKLVHDQLHQLEFNCYNRLRNNLPRLAANADDEFAVQEMTDCLTEFQSVNRVLSNLASRPSFTGITMNWVTDLVAACARFGDALGDPATEGKEYQRIVESVGRILARRPAQINQSLVAAAQALRLQDLVAAMKKVYSRLLNLEADFDRCEEFRKGVDELEALDRKLKQLIKIHAMWQDIDVELRPIEAVLADSIAKRDYAWWQNLQSLSRDLCGDGSASPDLTQWRAKLEGAILKGAEKEIKSSFWRFQRQAKVDFRDADEKLKRQCDELPGLFEPLQAVKEVLQ